MACLNCREGLPWECTNMHEGVPCNLDEPEAPVAEEEDDDRESLNLSYRTYKREGTLKDQQSTGRKRAAKLYPINLDDPGPCEWLGLKYAGGGQYPIVGCSGGVQQARHHGPDKNTLNNDKGNVHRICATCHNRWHTLNDPGYEAGASHARHDPVTKFTPEEFAANVMFWADRKLVKAKD